MRNKQDGFREAEIYSGDCGADSALSALIFDHENDPRLSLFEDSDPDFDGGDEASGEVAALHAEVGGDGSYDPDQASAFEKGRHLPFVVQRKRRSAKKELKKVTLEDFEPGPPRWAAETIIGAVRYFMDHVNQPSKVLDVATWLFGKSVDPASFENCCIVNRARPDVLRLRIHYELWRRGKYAVDPFNIPSLEIPSYVRNKSYFSTGDAGVRLAAILWGHPGVENERLERIMDSAMRKALSAMCRNYTISQHSTRWYLTGINPILEHQDRIDNSLGAHVSGSHRLDSRRSIDISWASRFPDD